MAIPGGDCACQQPHLAGEGVQRGAAHRVEPAEEQAGGGGDVRESWLIITL